MRKLEGSEALGLLYLANFIISFHLFLVVYINSSFLNSFIEEQFIGTVWIIGSIIGIGALIFIVQALRLFGNYRILVAISTIEIFIFLGLATIKSPAILVALFIAYIAFHPLILYNLDIFLESYTKKEGTTGSVRGTFLTISNTALIIAPLLAGIILTDGDYWKIYLISMTLLIPFMFIISKFRSFKDPVYHNLKIIENMRTIWANADLHGIFMSYFLLRFFFAWMVIYMPLYLYGHIGFSWTEIGFMFAIMLLPFALLEYPAGRIADKWLGEKELLSAGFVIMAFFTVLIPFITTASFITWTVILFMMRVGASLVEIMSESYFFKHVDGGDNNIIGLFRIVRPVSYIIGPIVASVTLLFFDLGYIFLILGIIVLYGLRYSLMLRDTK